MALRVTSAGRAALLGVLSALPLAIALWQFTVDDALIPARYAAHLASGHGYRFNAAGPVTDGVTPLGWAHLLVPWASGGPLAALRAAKLLGLAAWLLGGALLGRAVQSAGSHPLRYAALLLVLCSAPLAAWSVAGMETGVVLGLGATAAAARCLGRDRLTAVAAGLVAGLRPEALPWALVMALAPGRRTVPGRARGGPAHALARGPHKLELAASAVAPFVIVAVIRWLAFGHAAPLALAAKPSDFAHGWRYAAACFLLTGPIAAVAWRRLEPWCRGLQVAALVHFVAMALAGGDWMPLSRLVVPVLPGVVIVAAHVLDRSRAWIGVPRLGLAVVGLVFALVRAGPAAARVGQDRAAVIAELAPALRASRAVATLDIGWVGAATPAHVVDLAGVTDPAVAALPGGHTSKRIPPSLLVARNVDTLVLLLGRGESPATPWTHSRFSRYVEHHVASLPAMADEYTVTAVSRHPRLPYVVLRRR